MGALGTIGVATGGAAAVGTFVKTTGSVNHQLLRSVGVEASTGSGQWTLAVAANQTISADVNRVIMQFVHLGNARVYLRWDTTTVTAANCHWFLDPGERYTVPDQLAPCAVFMLAAGTGGTLNYYLGLNS